MKLVKNIILPSLFMMLGPLLSAQSEGEDKGLLWKIDGNSLEFPSYIYGTMHVADARVFVFPEGTENAFAQCSAFAMEVNTDSIDMLDLMASIMMTDGTSLEDLLGAKKYEQLEELFLEQTGMPMLFFNQVQPLYISILLTEQPFENDSSQYLDEFFHTTAKDQKKIIYGLESVQEQLDALSVLSYKEQSKLLWEQVIEFDEQTNLEEEMMAFYTKGELLNLLQISNEYKMPKKLVQSLVWDRNQKMAERISEYINQHPTFVAVGALHLPGEEGIIDLLRERGYSVTAVSN